MEFDSLCNCNCACTKVCTRATHTCPVCECEFVLANVSVGNSSWNLRAVCASMCYWQLVRSKNILCMAVWVCSCMHARPSVSMCVCVCVTGGGEQSIKGSASLWQIYPHHHLPLSDASISQLRAALWKLSIHLVLLTTYLIPGCIHTSHHIYQPIIKHLLV